MSKIAAGVAAVLVVALGVAGCGACPGYDSLLLKVAVFSTSGFEWESQASRTSKTGIPPEFLAWEAAITNASAATPSSSVLALNGPGGTLYLAIPLPLTVGQVVPVVRDDTLAEISFANTGPPRDSIGARFDDFCASVPFEDSAACDAYQPPIQGTGRVVTTSPLVIHLDFTIEGWPGGQIPPHLVVNGDLAFSATRGRACPGL
jgi:hypothetical protein